MYFLFYVGCVGGGLLAAFSIFMFYMAILFMLNGDMDGPVMVIFGIMLAAMASLVSFCTSHGTKDIPQSDYEWVVNKIEEFPAMEAYVREVNYDNEIDRYEFQWLKKKALKLKEAVPPPPKENFKSKLNLDV